MVTFIDTQIPDYITLKNYKHTTAVQAILTIKLPALS